MSRAWALPSSLFGWSDSVPILQLGLDGSYGERRPAVFSYAGVAGYGDDWTAAAREWQGVLDHYSLSRLHMVEVRRWEKSKRDELLNLLADVLSRPGFTTVGGSADEALLTQGSRARKARDLLVALVRQMIPIIPPDAQLALVCDRESDLAKEVLSWIDTLGRSEREVYERIAGVCYMNSRDVVTLQAADMVAYLFREDAERFIADPSSPVDPILERITHQGRMVRQLV